MNLRGYNSRAKETMKESKAKPFVAFYTGLFTPRGAKKHAGQNTDYLAGLLRA